MTPRNVIKNMTTKKCPHAKEIITEMKALEEQDVGYVKNLTRTQTVFYKPVPAEENREMIVEIIGSDRWDSYIHKILKMSIRCTSLHPNTIGCCKQHKTKTNWNYLVFYQDLLLLLLHNY